MPYTIDTVTGQRLPIEAIAPPPFGPGFQPEVVATATSMEILGSSATDPGPDWCRFVLKDADGAVIRTITIPGY
jgi:hypothetical protein